MRALPSKNVAAKAGPVNSSKQAASKSVIFSAIGTRKNGQEPGERRKELECVCCGRKIERSSTCTYTENENKKKWV
jgi:hypothetical protein